MFNYLRANISFNFLNTKKKSDLLNKKFYFMFLECIFTFIKYAIMLFIDLLN